MDGRATQTKAGATAVETTRRRAAAATSSALALDEIRYVSSL
jgi:hypothetical protein